MQAEERTGVTFGIACPPGPRSRCDLLVYGSRDRADVVAEHGGRQPRLRPAVRPVRPELVRCPTACWPPAASSATARPGSRAARLRGREEAAHRAAQRADEARAQMPTRRRGRQDRTATRSPSQCRRCARHRPALFRSSTHGFRRRITRTSPRRTASPRPEEGYDSVELVKRYDGHDGSDAGTQARDGQRRPRSSRRRPPGAASPRPGPPRGMMYVPLTLGALAGHPPRGRAAHSR
ncbi:hypothetical protein HBB16_09015 [Pseudonocardia sp. MCCB 268]|nr:hypothetical protein [Pseudonocardia cytotoxica]